MKKLTKVLLPFYFFLVISSCDTELNQATDDQAIDYTFEKDEMLTNLELAAIRLGEVAVNNEARQEIIQGVNVRFNGDVMVPMYDLMYPESSDLNLRIKTNYFSKLFLSNSPNARTQGNELKRLISYLEEHGFLIYAPYQDSFDWTSLTKITVSYHPIDRSDQNDGIAFDFSDRSDIVRSYVLVDDTYAKENACLLIIPAELSDGNEKYRPGLNSSSLGARRPGDPDGPIPDDPDDTTPPPLPPPATTYTCDNQPAGIMHMKLNQLQLRKQLDFLFSGGSEIRVWVAFPGCCYYVAAVEIADMFYTRSEINYGIWKVININYPWKESDWWNMNGEFETRLAILDEDGLGWPNLVIAGHLWINESETIGVNFYHNTGVNGDPDKSMQRIFTYCYALENAYDNDGYQTPIDWGLPNEFSILLSYYY